MLNNSNSNSGRSLSVRCVVLCRSAAGEAVFVPVQVQATVQEFNEGAHFDRARDLATQMGHNDADIGRVYDEYEPCFAAFLHLFPGVDEPVCCGG